MNEPALPLSTRLWFAFVCFLRILTDARFAGRAYLVRDALPPAPEAPPRPPPEPARRDAPEPAPLPPPAAPSPAGPGPEQGALQLLAMMQREGRLIDFLQEETAGVSDAELGAAVRTIHRGCQGALRSCVQLEPVRTEPEGGALSVPADYDAQQIKLTGALRGAGPYRGTLTHRGWRAAQVTLPTLLAGADARVLAPAEVELGG